MLDFLNDWGGLIGLVGAIVSLVGLILAGLAAYRAKKAEVAAEVASKETKTAMARVLTTVDLERAIALVQRIKALSRDGRWDTSLEQYQPLRVMLRNISSKHPDSTPELQQQLGRAILEITDMENNLYEAFLTGADPSEFLMFNVLLNEIQVYLEEIAGSIQYSEN